MMTEKSSYEYSESDQLLCGKNVCACIYILFMITICCYFVFKRIYLTLGFVPAHKTL